MIAVGVTMLVEGFFERVPVVLLGRKGSYSSMEADRSSFEGKWVTPGGRVNEGETLLDAIQREVREETGLAVSTGLPWFVQELIKPTGHYILHVFRAQVPILTPVIAGDDLTDVRWASLQEAIRLWPEMTPLTQDILRRAGFAGRW